MPSLVIWKAGNDIYIRQHMSEVLLTEGQLYSFMERHVQFADLILKKSMVLLGKATLKYIILSPFPAVMEKPVLTRRRIWFACVRIAIE